MATPIPSNANEFIEQQLNERIQEIELHLESDSISFSGPILFGVDNLIRNAIETKHNESNNEKIIVILTTI